MFMPGYSPCTPEREVCGCWRERERRIHGERMHTIHTCSSTLPSLAYGTLCVRAGEQGKGERAEKRPREQRKEWSRRRGALKARCSSTVSAPATPMRPMIPPTCSNPPATHSQAKNHARQGVVTSACHTCSCERACHTCSYDGIQLLPRHSYVY